MAQVEITELEVIRRFSVATRGATAPLEEVVEALRADLDALTQDTPTAGIGAEAEKSTVPRTATQASRRRASAKRTTSGGSGGRKRSRVS